MAGSGVDKQDYITNTSTTFSKSDGSTDDLSTWANNEIAESQKAYKYYQSMGDTKGMQDAHARAENARNLMGYYGSDDGSTLYKVDQEYVDRQVAKQKELWEQAHAVGNTKGENEAHAAAERYRGLLGKAGGSDGSQDYTTEHLKEWVDQQIADAKARWQVAYEKGDQEGMAKAHYDAEYARARLGYSGGVDGSEKLNIYNGANYQSDTATPFVATSGFGSTSESNTTSGTSNNSGRSEVTLGGNKYWMDSAGILYDSEGNVVGSGYNSATGQLTYTDDNQALSSALKVLESRYGVTGWAAILKRLNLTEIPDGLVDAAKSGTLSSYINQLEQSSSNSQNNNNNAINTNTLMALLDAYIAQNGGGGYQYITPARYNQAVYPINNWVDNTGTMATGNPTFQQFVPQNLENPYRR